MIAAVCILCAYLSGVLTVVAWQIWRTRGSCARGKQLDRMGLMFNMERQRVVWFGRTMPWRERDSAFRVRMRDRLRFPIFEQSQSSMRARG